MNPVKRKVIIEKLSEELDIPSSKLDKLVNHYYQHVMNTMTGCTHVNVNVPGLGVFYVKSKSLERKILRTNGYVNKLKFETSLRAYAIRMDRTENLEKLLFLQEMLNQEKLRKQTIRELQKHYENYDEQNQNNLGEQEADLSRN